MPDGKVNVVQAVEFKVNLADYNSDEEIQGTRVAGVAKDDTVSRRYVELGNDLLAEITVRKDIPKRSKSQDEEEHTMTRTLADDSYTMLAYKDGILRGKVTGNVSNGVFTADLGGAGGIILTSGETYDFVLCNSKVHIEGNKLTVNRADVGLALIGRTSYQVTTSKNQQVEFNLKHTGARMRIKLTGLMDIKTGITATLSSVDATSIPGTAIYDASTDTWSNGKDAEMSGNLSFPASTEEPYISDIYTSMGNEYQYFLPKTNASKLKVKFTGGKIYNRNMNGAELTLSVPLLSSMSVNGSYIVNVKLMYNFLYLMSDGKTGYFNRTIYAGGDKIPVGVVVNRDMRLAVALKDANEGKACMWYGRENKSFLCNSSQYPTGDEGESGSYRDMDGYKYTWDPNGSSDKKTIKANAEELYPAFYYAGNYGKELAKSVTLTNGMENKNWYLPSFGEWLYVFTALGWGDDPSGAPFDGSTFYWYGKYANIAFTQVGGIELNDLCYWSSTEFNDGEVVALVLDPMNPFWGFWSRTNQVPVRAFVKY